MRYFLLLVFCVGIFYTKNINAQSHTISPLPPVALKDLQGKTINTGDLMNEGKPFIIDFWATWCKPCILELNTIAENYEDWQKETGVKIYAISIDDARNSPKVGPLASGKGWEYEILLDENSDLKRALNVNNIPHTFLLNGKGEIVWQHNSYTPGDEDLLYENLKNLIAGKPLTH